MRTYTVPSLLSICLLLVFPGAAQNQASSADPASSSQQNPSAALQRENYDPLLDLPPLPHNSVTLMGGIVVNADEVMNRMTFRPFGTKQKLQVHFDTRTHFYLDGKPITERDIKPGQRIYLDTMLNGDRVFAKTIWIRSTTESGVGRGQIISFDPKRQLVTIHDELSNQPVKLQMTQSTVVRKGNQPGSESDLVEGALVNIDFGAQHDLRSITVLATPGSVFTFAGRVTYVDLSQKLISVDNQSDGKKYDISMEAIAESVLRQIHEGDNVSVSAVFEGNGYSARSVDIAAAGSSEKNP
jgi:hypothetical protein